MPTYTSTLPFPQEIHISCRGKWTYDQIQRGSVYTTPAPCLPSTQPYKFAPGRVTLTVPLGLTGRLGDTCRVHDDCSVVIDSSTCSNGACACDLGYVATDDGTGCRLLAINDRCVWTPACGVAIKNTRCLQGRCQCARGWFWEKDADACVKRQLGDACADDGDCSAVVENSVCADRRCSCRSEHNRIEGNDSRCVVGDVAMLEMRGGATPAVSRDIYVVTFSIIAICILALIDICLVIMLCAHFVW